MASNATPLKEVDRVEITTVLDNFIDVLLAGSETVKRAALGRDWVSKETLIAEHGFSALVKVSTADHSDTLLFDAGLSKGGLMHNLDVLDGKPDQVHAIVLSHGHADHTQGLMGLVERLGSRRMPLLIHPDARLERKVVFPDGHEIDLPPPDSRVLTHEGIELIEERAPSYLMGGLIMVTGQVHRTTPFETGFPVHYAKVDQHWQPDPLIHDDQAVVVNVKGKGLVVLTGCGHAGVINTIRHAQALTGVKQVRAVLGGFHLTGAIFEPIIAPTIAALREIRPQMMVPAHCTGWRATHAIAREFPNAFIQNSVGTRFVI